ncbi:unnamed protein product [Mytilus edulis]|uniref:Ig-like domain-containing protein n=1 Tax=Mytilus edulis TaxID=6550 RepID=A0A8S3QNH7_MYTED|nr:unnamed protein product [Mytilus edulis]
MVHSISVECVPCPPGYKKDTIGCGPCLRVPGNNTIIKPSPVPETTTAKSAIQTYQPKPPVAETTTTTTTIVAINQHDQEEGLQLLNRNENLNNLGPEQQDNINNMRNMHVIERNISHVSVTDKPDNNNLARVDSECPSVRFNSDSSVSINRQLSNITVTDRINSTASENSPLMQVNSNSPCVNRANSVPDRQVLHHGELLVNRQVLNRAEKFTSSQSDKSVIAFTYTLPIFGEWGCGACIPPPDFDNIQSSSPVMNTELPNIAEFKRSLSKDSESSADNLNSTSPYSSIPEETGKEIQEEVTAVSNPSTTMLDPPHMSDVRDYNDCHNLSHGTVITEALNALTGSTAQLKCSFKADAVLGERLQWLKGSLILTENTLIGNSEMKDRLTITGDHSIGEYHLNISNIKESDMGVYKCFNTNKYEVETHQLIVIVTGSKSASHLGGGGIYPSVSEECALDIFH